MQCNAIRSDPIRSEAILRSPFQVPSECRSFDPNLTRPSGNGGPHPDANRQPPSPSQLAYRITLLRLQLQLQLDVAFDVAVAFAAGWR